MNDRCDPEQMATRQSAADKLYKQEMADAAQRAEASAVRLLRGKGYTVIEPERP